MGRMLVPLFMWRRQLIRQPAFYISAYFEANRDAYYEGLLSVSRDDDWTGWCEFFLARISHTVTAEGFGGSVGAEFLPREQVEQKQAALRPCFRGARVAGTAA